MKKLLLLGISSFLFSGMYAQNQQKPMVSVDKNDSYIISKSKPTSLVHAKDKTRASSRWMNIVDAVDKSTGTIFSNFNNVVSAPLMWQDSTMKALYALSGGGTGQEGIWIKGIGQTIDPVADHFSNGSNYPGEVAFQRGKAYTVDSIGVYGIYNRNPAKASVVDTLIITVVNSSNITAINETQTAVTSNYSTDTLRNSTFDLNFNTLTIAGASAIVTKIPLTAASANDTLPTGWNYFQVPVNLNVAGTGINIAAASVFFKSGDTWTPNVDSVGSGTPPIYNNFRFVSFEESPTTYRSYTKGDYNASHMSLQDTTGWGEFFIPSFYFTSAGFGFEYHWLDWKLSCPTCNVPTAVLETELFTTLQATPNPAHNNVTFNINMNNSAKQVRVELFNALGQSVKSLDLGSMSANIEKSVNMDISDLQSGLYIYTISADGQKVSKKLMVN
jgi:hypothetical protein